MAKPKKRSAVKKIIAVNPDKCTGCRICEAICSFQHFERVNPALSRFWVTKNEESGFDFPALCLHCEDPLCVEACPIGAIEKKENGVAVIDQTHCRGCRICMMACPFGVISTHRGRMIKCDLCEGEPQCVQWCPTGALTLCQPEFATHDRREQIADLFLDSTVKSREMVGRYQVKK